MTQPAPLLSVQDLQIGFGSSANPLLAIRGVTFDIGQGEILGLVGESGSGKSLTALSLLGLGPSGARALAGRVMLGDVNVVRLPPRGLRALRGKTASMVFQEPLTSLDPVKTIGMQVVEPLRIHGLARGRAAWERALSMLSLVGIPDARTRMLEYPHQLSGGMRQRVMIAIALICDPRLLIADEPTTALDVTIQSQILKLMTDMRDRLGTAILLITHNLGVVATTCDRVAVMYAGKIVEIAPTRDLFASPRHPYTRALLAVTPRLGARQAGAAPLMPIPGSVPALNAMPAGCAFAARCPEARALCREQDPPPGSENDHSARCWNVLPAPERLHA